MTIVAILALSVILMVLPKSDRMVEISLIIGAISAAAQSYAFAAWLASSPFSLLVVTVTILSFAFIFLLTYSASIFIRSVIAEATASRT
jgi:hypothetical protein